MAQRLTLVIGGAASGKSVHAEALVTARALPRAYLATGWAGDAEMAAKIARHQARRQGWQEIEAGGALAEALAELEPGSVALVDCATMWLTAKLLEGADLAVEETRLMEALAACPAEIVIVSNEIGLSGVPDNALARTFREAQGRLNQRLAAAADEVVAIIAGLPLRLKP